MNKKYILFAAFIFYLSILSPTYAANLEELSKDGYAVAEKTSILGEFNGCEFDKIYKLANGLIFKCAEFNYYYSYNPEVYILEHIKNGDYKVVINNNEYYGSLYR